MTLARANSTIEARLNWLERMKHPNVAGPRFEPTRDKPLGSKKLVLGQWVTVTEDDPNVAK